jgi:CBS domain-containing protein
MKPVARVQPGVSIAHVAVVLRETGRETVVVNTVPLSEMTERDLVAALAKGATAETPVSEIARAAPQMVHPDTPAEIAVTIMVACGRRSLVVVDRSRPLGVITLASATAVLWSRTSWMGAMRSALHLEGSM